MILRNYQLEAINEILNKRRIIVADDMGFGKSAEAIAAKIGMERLKGVQGPALIVCPGSVKEHWVNEIKKWYHKKENTNIAMVNSTTYHSDIRSAQNADFVITSYPSLSYFGDEQSAMNEFRKMNFSYGIIDEAHNAKNPDSIRSRAVRGLLHEMPYVALLSGTPVPNTIIDIYSLLNIVAPEKFPLDNGTKQEIFYRFFNIFKKDPELIRNELNAHLIGRKVDEGYLSKGFPKLNSSNLEVKLSGDHRETYLRLLDNDSISPGPKLHQLLKASIDPNIVNPEFLPVNLADKIGSMNSDVYSALENKIREITSRKDGKVLIFSDLKTGVVGKLERMFSQYGALTITGDTTSDKVENEEFSEREKIRKQFQNNPENKVLIATTVMDEGVDLTAATAVIHLTLPFMPSTYLQRIRRTQRITAEVDKSEVDSYVIMPMIEGVPVITEGSQKLLNEKQRIIYFLLTDINKLTRQNLEEIKNGSPQKSRFISDLIKSDRKKVYDHLISLKGRGSEFISRRYCEDEETARNIANMYALNWEDTYGGNASRLVKEFVFNLDKEGKAPIKLDIASGPFSLSRAIGSPVINVDLNKHMIAAGRKLEEDGKIPKGNIAHVGFAHNIPLESRSVDLANCSLALHMTKVLPGHGEEFGERERTLREANRVLKSGGNYLLTLPLTKVEEMAPFYSALNHLGFEVSPVSGFYRGNNPTRFKTYVALAKKVDEPNPKPLDPEMLMFGADKAVLNRVKSASKARKNGLPKPKDCTPEIVQEFFGISNGKSLDEILEGGLHYD